MRLEANKYLFDIRRAVLLLTEFTAGKTFDNYVREAMQEKRKKGTLPFYTTNALPSLSKEHCWRTPKTFGEPRDLARV